jgi:hypothetical protein
MAFFRVSDVEPENSNTRDLVLIANQVRNQVPNFAMRTRLAWAIIVISDALRFV